MLVAVENVPEIVLWAPLVTAVLGVAAATAAWRTASVTARSFRRSVLPDLHPLFVWDTGPSGRGVLELTVYNVGGGPAKIPTAMVVVKDRAMHMNVGFGYLKPGHGFRITTTIRAAGLEPGDYQAVVGCRDVNGVYHAWSHAEQHREFRDRLRRPLKNIDLREVFRTFFPEGDLETKERIRYSVRYLEP